MSGWDLTENFWFTFLSSEEASKEAGWVTCQDEDPFSGLSNNWKSEVKVKFFE